MRSIASNRIPTPGGRVEIQGLRLKFDPADTALGVFVTVGGVAKRVGAKLYATIGDDLLLFDLPAVLDADDSAVLIVKCRALGGDIHRAITP